MTAAWRQIRARLVAGALIALPFVATIWIVGLLVRAVDHLLSGLGLHALEWAGWTGGAPGWAIRLASLLVVLLVLYLLGVGATHVAGRQALKIFEWAMGRIPLLGSVYRTLRQVTDALGARGSGALRRCVLIEYPRRGLWTMAFVTNERTLASPDPGADPLVPVFVPTTPNPTSGYFLLVPRRDCRPLDIPVEEGVKLVVSGGILLPPRLVPAAGAGPER